MKNYLKFGLAGLMAMNGSALADAPPDGWYWGILGEVSKTPSINFTIPYSDFVIINTTFAPLFPLPVPPTLPTPTGTIKYNMGYGGGIDAGYRYCGFRFEGEVLYNTNKFDSVSFAGVTITSSQNTSLAFPFSNLTVSGNSDLKAGLLNFYYDFYNFDDDDVSWIPYLGFGVGYGILQNRLTLNAITPSGLLATGTTTGGTTTTPLATLRQKTNTPVGQIIGGVAYQFNESFSAGLDYRYVTTKTLTGFNKRYILNTINLTLTYWMGDDQ